MLRDAPKRLNGSRTAINHRFSSCAEFGPGNFDPPTRRRGDRIIWPMSGNGTFETSADVRYAAAFGGKADITRCFGRT
jgi:hypothetical protein